MTSSGLDQFGSDALDAFEESAPVRHGLPAFAYTRAAFWELECARLFPHSWVFVGFAHEMARPGDVVPVSIGGRPVVLVRDQQGAIRAFHNTCRHRGLKLVDQPGNAGRLLRCPYHCWTYELSGELRKAPYFGGPDDRMPEGFDPAEHGLVPVSCRSWHDWIFVNLDGNAMAFDEFVAPLEGLLEGLDFEQVKPVATIDLGEVRANWKLLMENFIEPYHVQFVHSKTTDQPLTDHYTVTESWCLGSAVDVSRETGAEARDGTLGVSSRYLTLFPIFVFGRYFPDQIGVHLNQPVDFDRTRQRRVIYSTLEPPMPAETVEQLETLWYRVHKEDHAICERLQQGRASVVAERGGVLSPHWEGSVRRFQELVLEAVRSPG